MVKWLLILPLGFLVLAASACGYRQQQQIIVMPQYQYSPPPTTYVIQTPAPQIHYYIAPRPAPYPVPYPVPHTHPFIPYPPYR